MAMYRTVALKFWEDAKIIDDMTPEDRYFFLYLLTNPHTSLSGCYEITTRQIVNETGYSADSVKMLLHRMADKHNVILYSEETKEVLIKNWCKYNWTKSTKIHKPIIKEILNIKNKEMILEMKKIGYRYGSDTSSIDTTDTDTDTDTDTVSDTDKNEIFEKRYFNNQKLNDTFIDYLKVRKSLGTTDTEVAIEYIKKSLEGYSIETKIEILSKSISNNWKGLFPDNKKYEKVPKWMGDDMEVTNSEEEKEEMTEGEVSDLLADFR